MTFLKRVCQQAEELLILTTVVFAVSGLIAVLANFIDLAK